MDLRKLIQEEVSNQLKDRVVEESAVDTWVVRKIEAEKYLGAIVDYFDRLEDRYTPDEINWGNVGTLGRVVEDLKEITEFLNIRVR